MFKKYPKIHRLGNEDSEGILDHGFCYIQEKIDGANTQLWVEDGKIMKGSRNLTLSGGFNGFCEYVDNHKGINSLLKLRPEYRLYGEWLVKHSIQYKETAYKQFYLFDIEVDGEFMPLENVYLIAGEFGIKTPELFATIDTPTIEQLTEIAGKSVLGDTGEGIVIKNHDFVNKFGNRAYAKLVTEQFKEVNAITFGGNNKHSESYFEMYVVNKYCTLGRVQKIMNKIQPTIDERLDMKHIPRITGTVHHDILTECIWEIAKKVRTLDFKKLESLVYKKAKQIYVDILNDDVSVADKEDE